MGTQQPIRKIVAPEIPDKLYFRIGDVARLCEVATYVLRFWETEFPQLKPHKGGTGQRLYRRRDVELALRIKSLLYDQGYTIPGARQVFKNEAASRSAEATAPPEPLSAPAATAAAGTAAPPDSGALLRQQARLHDLRADMAALLAALSQPAEPGSLSPEPEARARKAAEQPDLKVQTLRPRLVLEPRAATPRLPLPQRELFSPSAEAADEWPQPPAAS